MRELKSADEVRSACADDALIMWAAQGMKPGVRAWAAGNAVAVAAPDLFRRDRIIVIGDPGPAAGLVRHALAECGPTFRVVGDEPLVRELTARLPELESYVVFDWMDTDRLTPPGPYGTAAAADGVAVRWLDPDEDPKVANLLEVASPTSWAQPGLPGVRRWAGAWRDGELVACAADAWSSPTVGLIAGVATAPAHRGRRYAEAVCRHIATALLAAHGRVALMVDADNHAAIRVYTRLGLTRRGIAAARVG